MRSLERPQAVQCSASIATRPPLPGLGRPRRASGLAAAAPRQQAPRGPSLACGAPLGSPGNRGSNLRPSATANGSPDASETVYIPVSELRSLVAQSLAALGYSSDEIATLSEVRGALPSGVRERTRATRSPSRRPPLPASAPASTLAAPHPPPPGPAVRAAARQQPGRDQDHDRRHEPRANRGPHAGGAGHQAVRAHRRRRGRGHARALARGGDGGREGARPRVWRRRDARDRDQHGGAGLLRREGGERGGCRGRTSGGLS
jgi:hypothetical protein